ncbi:ATP-dependent Clp protease ATP-binding subunit [Candidatus Kaiserbacteria bacterium]|nr:ATP-dependent Clp protease ATP-binding subunit [Candidatus Kaiserbacteria bacterium]
MFTLKNSLRYHKPAIALTKIISRDWLNRLRLIFGTIAVLAGLLSVFLLAVGQNDYFDYAIGLTLIATSLWIEQLLLYSFHNYYYFFGLENVIGISSKPESGITYEVAEAFGQYENDVFKGFALSPLGSLVLSRTGITKQAISEYLNSSDRTIINTESIPVDNEKVVTLINIGIFILQNDPAFSKLLGQSGVQKEHFIGALNWVIKNNHALKRREKWWSRDMLSKTPGIARTWTYGHTYHLERYTKSLYSSAVFGGLTRNYDFSAPYINKLEEALARNQAANALIIGQPGVGKMDIVIGLADKIKQGNAIASVIDQNFVTLDTDAIFANSENKVSFENIFTKLLNESLGAGNIILVIENMSNFIKQAESIGSYVPELMDEYLAHPHLHIIALDTPSNFHNTLERNSGFTRRFEEILIEEPGQEGSIFLLQSIATQYEQNGLFTYPAIEAIAVGADRYLVDGVMPDKAIALLTDVAMRAPENYIYTPDLVYSVIAQKTGMPVGPVTSEERDVLLNLEDTLHARVIGQDSALSAISSTMRRARAGIVNSDRPIGSFLFLGPTGVGKTETAKALAYIFFGDEDKMVRLDMSEYGSEDRVGHMIGNNEESGVLPSLLQERPYSVLLLDEFEKADPTIHDIFLQILDEGMFTSGFGEKINARNTIIIATSNAGSNHIMDAVKEGRDLKTITRDIIEEIVSTGIYRPELINRFDNTIIFEPLTITEQHSVAKLMLASLQSRINDQGYQISLTPALVDALVQKGYDPVFGARPMQRVIQDVIEEAVAQNIIGGLVQKGDTIHLDVNDVNL